MNFDDGTTPSPVEAPEGTDPSERHVRRLGRQTVLSLLGAAISAVAGFGLVLFAARGLTDDEAGSALLAIAVFSIVARVAQLGTGSALVHFMTRELLTRDDRGLVALLKMALGPVVAASTTLGLGLYIFADPLSALIPMNEAHGALAQSLRIAAMFVPATAVMTVLLDATRGHSQIRPTVFIGRIGRPAIQIFGIAIAIALGGGPAALTFAWVAPSVPALVAVVFALRKTHKRVIANGARATTAVQTTSSDFWAFSRPQAGVDSIRTLVRWQDGLLIGVLLGPGPAAMYVAVTRLVKIASLANHALSDTVTPHVGEALAENDQTRAAALYRASTAWLILLLGPIYLATAFYADTFTSIFGASYREAATVLVILSLGKLAGTLVGSVEAILIVSGRPAMNLGNHLASLISNISLNLLLVPWIGLSGAALAWVVSILITNYGPYLQLRRATGLTPFCFTTWAVIVAVALAVAAPATVVNLGFGQTPLSTTIGLAFSACLLLVGVHQNRVRLQLDRLIGSQQGTRRPHTPLPATSDTHSNVSAGAVR